MLEPVSGVFACSASLLSGENTCLRAYAGRVLLIVNTASKCGYTPQYQGLEELYRTYRERGFTVLGFPCNQFGRQEPGTADEIGAFCQKNYGVSFPLFVKIDVNGPNTHPLYQYLKAARPGFLGMRRIQWNFTKFLIDRKGHVVRRYAPAREPRLLAAEIERLLAQPA